MADFALNGVTYQMASRVFPFVFCIILYTCVNIGYCMCCVGTEIQEAGEEYSHFNCSVQNFATKWEELSA